MKRKSFQTYLEKRLSKEEISQIEEQAQLETRIVETLQVAIAQAIEDYMKKNNIGFNEIVRRLDYSPTQVAKLKRGEANPTLSTMAHVFALLGKEPQDIFKIQK